MRPIDEKGSYNHGLAQANNAGKKVLGSRSKPTPSKWDDAQKWLAGLSSGGDHGHAKNKPRNSNADDRRLLNSASQRGRESTSSADLGLYEDVTLAIHKDEGETKNIDGDESLWRMSKPTEETPLEVKSICLRDVGTEMTPMASQEPSRTGTPLRATSPIDSRASSPGRGRQVVQANEKKNEVAIFGGGNGANVWSNGRNGDLDGHCVAAGNVAMQTKAPSSLESRALAWDEAERAKYMARYKREDVKIQAWENHEKRKAEMEMKRVEVKAERMKSRAQEKMANKLAASRRIAEEKRANAEAKLSEQAVRTAERADYIRRTGRLPFNFSISIKLPSMCG